MVDREETMNPKTSKKEPKEPGVQSLRRAFSVLEAVCLNPEGLNLAQISKAVGLHNSTTFHLIKTMVSLGVLQQDQRNKTYHVGAHLFALARGATDDVELARISAPILEDLARETGENSHIAVRTSEGVVIIDKREGSAQVRMNERIGAVRPAHATAVGKAILAGLSDEQLNAFLEHHELTEYTTKTITDSERLMLEIAQVRENGIAYDDAEFNEEARCLASPVFDLTGQVVGSIGISGPVWRIGLQNLPKLSDAVRRAANDLSSRLGNPGSPKQRLSDELLAVL